MTIPAQPGWDWSPYATGGATRPDSFSGMNDPFSMALEQMFMNAPPEIRDQLQVRSGYRSPERQQQLWDEAAAKYPDPEVRDNWVARPGGSQHEHGNAADLGYLDDAAREWAHANAAAYGLAFPLGNEPWHIELASARGQGGTPNALTTAGAPAQPAPPPTDQNALAQRPEFQMTDARQDPMAFMSKRRFGDNALGGLI